MIFRREDLGSFISIVRTDSVQQSHKVEEKTKKTAGNSDSILLIESEFGLDNIHCWCKRDFSLDPFCGEVA